MVRLVAGRDMHGGVLARFLGRLLAPAAGDHDIHLAPARQVQRHDGVFSQPTALHEQDAKLGWHREQFAQIALCRFDDGHEVLATVAHLHHAHAAALPVEHLGGGLLQHLDRHGGRAGGEVVGTQ